MSAAVARAALPAGQYFDSALQTAAIKLLPADYAVTAEPVAIVTLLGSCVAACVYDPALQVGGMNHFMLPDSHASDLTARYGMHAMELLINELLKRGARRSRLQAKAFGGGNVLRGFQDPIGTRNADFVIDYLRAERIPLVAQDLGDIFPRKICFFPQTGRTLVKRLPATREREVADVERAYQSRLSGAPTSGGVELF